VRTPPPRKPAGKATGPRTLNGDAMDVATFSREQGQTEKTTWAQIQRRVIPFRKLGGRVVILRSEIQRFYEALPGVTVEEALKNLQERNGEGTA
jgi:hypothetical protein